MRTSAATTAKAKKVIVWILKILVAALFLFAAVMKLSGQPMMVAEFDTVGLGQWFRYFTGVLELIGTITLLVPRRSSWGVALLLLIDIGALITQLTILHGDVIHTIVIAAILGLIIYLQRPASALPKA